MSIKNRNRAASPKDPISRYVQCTVVTLQFTQMLVTHSFDDTLYRWIGRDCDGVGKPKKEANLAHGENRQIKKIKR